MSAPLRRWIKRTVSGLPPVLVASAALAAGGEESDSHQIELVWQAVNLALLIGIIVYGAKKPIQDFFSERREQIQDEMESASRYLKQAELKHSEWQRKLADLETELQRIRATSRQRAQEERDRILAEAEVAAERIREDARAAVDQEVRRAQTELRREASELSVELAANLLREHVTDADRDRLVDEFITSVEQTPRGDHG